MTVVGIIRANTLKTLKEDLKQYPAGMSRQEYNFYKEEVEREIEMKNDSKFTVEAAFFKKNSLNSTSSISLDEARGRPPKEGSAAWNRQQAAKKGEEGETQEADKNIHTQLHKVISAGKPITFKNGKTHNISSAHAHKALAILQNSKPSERLNIQNSLSHSHDRFQETIKTGKAVVEPPKSKITLAKRVAEEVDPSTHRADRGAMVVRAVRKPDGSYTLEKTKKGAVKSKDIIDAQEQTEVIKKDLSKINMAADSMKKYEKDPLFSKIKFKLPPTQGNKPIGGEDQVHVGKFSMAEEKTLNNLYNDLSEENKELFNNIIKTDEGVASLIKFATQQGY